MMGGYMCFSGRDRDALVSFVRLKGVGVGGGGGVEILLLKGGGWGVGGGGRWMGRDVSWCLRPWLKVKQSGWGGMLKAGRGSRCFGVLCQIETGGRGNVERGGWGGGRDALVSFVRLKQGEEEMLKGGVGRGSRCFGVICQIETGVGREGRAGRGEGGGWCTGRVGGVDRL